VTAGDEVKSAARGCNLVFHLAYGNSGTEETQRRVTVQGTRNVLEAALHARVERFVHLSTVMVYGAPSDGQLDENSPRRRSGGVYPDSKLEAEKLAVDFANKHGLPITVLQPTTVYGPFAPFWTNAILQSLRTGRVMLVNAGEGLCNPVYVDDVVNAIFLAAVRKEAIGEAFLVSDGHPVTWKEFYARYEHMLGVSATVSITVAEAIAYYLSRQKRKSLFTEMRNILRNDRITRERLLGSREMAFCTKLAKSLLPRRLQQPLKNLIGSSDQARPGTTSPAERPIVPMSPALVRFCAAKTRVQIEKARQLLGYQPAFDLDSGMGLTEQWAKWAGLL